mmetsp:Transcript_25388/g.37391  ORF Transcript_25388/g.37391 Transcript_25388/m.37391 type:complete len:491 (-) Transcript_25388:221-1693(-)|eukprot:CAMPEP_0195519550 /NCGR_PEP_ID=MMETSP0794_2-20130614/15035_1 /TAXON_ID=515487 /ORGANISM="Stephanopyxis turris, Strain CCMP 815" /LENGTH=490 /DNA_ID=CAMNT_0040648729 /DNA_START=209 /DNA_END=1681 /DNA_ORIENTATION=-
MKMTKSSLPSLLLVAFSKISSNAVVHAPSSGWMRESYPNPFEKGSSCGSSHLCDPDQILRPSDVTMLNEKLLSLEQRHFIRCNDNERGGPSVEMAVALVEKISIPPHILKKHKESAIDKETEKFARELHDDWGVGIPTEKCGSTGILLFISIQDRSIFISTGGAVQRILTDRRLDEIIESIKPMMRSLNYATAVREVISEIDVLLKKGPPSAFEKALGFMEEYFIFMFIAFIGLIVWYDSYKTSKERRVYAEVESQLSQIDQERAMLLQDQYRCISCPICLEPFAPPQQETNNTSGSISEDNGASADQPTIGSDGLPLKLLRCGHVFDDSCWKEWVASGQGDVRKCPICREDVTGSSPSTTSTILPSSESIAASDAADPTSSSVPNSPLIRRSAQSRSSALQERRRGLNALETQFRLMRLMNRYPRYINQSQVRRWSNPEYDGRIVQDREFVRSKPTTQSTSSSSGSRGGHRSSGGFGGGSSSGGRGGRW